MRSISRGLAQHQSCCNRLPGWLLASDLRCTSRLLNNVLLMAARTVASIARSIRREFDPPPFGFASAIFPRALPPVALLPSLLFGLKALQRGASFDRRSVHREVLGAHESDRSRSCDDLTEELLRHVGWSSPRSATSSQPFAT